MQPSTTPAPSPALRPSPTNTRTPTPWSRPSGRISRIDYLGTFCLAEVGCDGIEQPLSVSFSLNQLHDLGVREGERLEFALRPDRVRVFADGAR